MWSLHKEKYSILCNTTKFIKMLENHYKEAFERASEERQELILETGIEEFSSKGYEKANINVIAKKCGISIGLMYKYFSTKEDLFITCLQRGMKILDDTLDDIMASDDKLLVKAEKVIRATCFHSKKYANYIKLYNEVTALKNGEMVVTLATAIEESTSRKYITSLKPLFFENILFVIALPKLPAPISMVLISLSTQRISPILAWSSGTL